METVRGAFTTNLAKSTRRFPDIRQFWGRIIGTSADAENQQWLLKKFTEIGLSDVHPAVVRHGAAVDCLAVVGK